MTTMTLTYLPTHNPLAMISSRSMRNTLPHIEVHTLNANLHSERMMRAADWVPCLPAVCYESLLEPSFH